MERLEAAAGVTVEGVTVLGLDGQSLAANATQGYVVFAGPPVKVMQFKGKLVPRGVKKLNSSCATKHTT